MSLGGACENAKDLEKLGIDSICFYFEKIKLIFKHVNFQNCTCFLKSKTMVQIKTLDRKQ